MHKSPNLSEALATAYHKYCAQVKTPPKEYELILAISSLTQVIAIDAPHADSREFPLKTIRQTLDVRSALIRAEATPKTEAAQ